jgi:hypothetical protein
MEGSLLDVFNMKEKLGASMLFAFKKLAEYFFIFISRVF